MKRPECVPTIVKIVTTFSNGNEITITKTDKEVRVPMSNIIGSLRVFSSPQLDALKQVIENIQTERGWYLG